MTARHNEIRMKAARKLEQLSENVERQKLDAPRFLRHLDAADALADYAIALFIDRLRAKGLSIIADLFDDQLLPPTSNPKDQQC